MTDMNTTSKLCPMCAQPNGCAMGAATGEARLSSEPVCWCQRVEIDAAVLRSIPEELRASETKGGACLCAACAGGAVPSPCIQVCQLDAASQACIGCQRTMAEISSWPRLDDDAKRRLLWALALRRTKSST